LGEKLIKSSSKVVKEAAKKMHTTAKTAKNHSYLGRYGRAAKRAKKAYTRTVLKRTAPADLAISATAKAVSQNQDKDKK
jgi:hypothetical protein